MAAVPTLRSCPTCGADSPATDDLCGSCGYSFVTAKPVVPKPLGRANQPISPGSTNTTVASWVVPMTLSEWKLVAITFWSFASAAAFFLYIAIRGVINAVFPPQVGNEPADRLASTLANAMFDGAILLGLAAASALAWCIARLRHLYANAPTTRDGWGVTACVLASLLAVWIIRAEVRHAQDVRDMKEAAADATKSEQELQDSLERIRSAFD